MPPAFKAGRTIFASTVFSTDMRLKTVGEGFIPSLRPNRADRSENLGARVD
jgi:hypothetical protein